MRFAELVNHRIFERKWRSRVILRACLFECPFAKNTKYICFLSDAFLTSFMLSLSGGAWGMAAFGCVLGRRVRHTGVTLNLVRQGRHRLKR